MVAYSFRIDISASSITFFKQQQINIVQFICKELLTHLLKANLFFQCYSDRFILSKKLILCLMSIF